jgi:hypothetical protein
VVAGYSSRESADRDGHGILAGMPEQVDLDAVALAGRELAGLLVCRRLKHAKSLPPGARPDIGARP